MELNSCLCCVCVCGVLLCVFCVIQQKDIYVINLACPNPNMSADCIALLFCLKICMSLPMSFPLEKKNRLNKVNIEHSLPPTLPQPIK